MVLAKNYLCHWTYINSSNKWSTTFLLGPITIYESLNTTCISLFQVKLQPYNFFHSCSLLGFLHGGWLFGFTLFGSVSKKGWLKHNHEVSTVNYPFVKTKITYLSKKILTRHFMFNYFNGRVILRMNKIKKNLLGMIIILIRSSTYLKIRYFWNCF